MAEYDRPEGVTKALFNPFRVEIACESAFPGFAPRAGLFHPSGVVLSGLRLRANQLSRGLHPGLACSTPPGWFFQG